MKTFILGAALALGLVAGTAHANTFDPQGPELPDTISLDGNYSLNGILNGVSILGDPPAGQENLAVEFTATDTSTGDTEEFYDEFQVPVGATDYEVEVPRTNDASIDPFTLSGAGFLLSPTQIPLDDLNLFDPPAPGTSDSPYTPIPSFDESGSLSGSGAVEDLIVSTPLPKTALGLAACLGCLAGLKLIRRKRDLSPT